MPCYLSNVFLKLPSHVLPSLHANSQHQLDIFLSHWLVISGESRKIIWGTSIHTFPLPPNRVFHEHTELTIMKVLASQVLLKKSSDKMLAQWAFNSQPQPFGTHARLSEPLGQVLPGISLNCLLFMHHFNKILALHPNGWGSEFNAQWGKHFVAGFFFVFTW